MECLHDPANVRQTSSKCNAGRLLDLVNTPLCTLNFSTQRSFAELLFKFKINDTLLRRGHRCGFATNVVAVDTFTPDLYNKV